MSFKVVLLFALLAGAMAFTPSRFSVKSKTPALKMSVFDKAVKDWAEEYPAPYSVGWGPTTKAERWNGRHAMFGWIALLFTGYAKSHGLIPNPDTLLDLARASGLVGSATLGTLSRISKIRWALVPARWTAWTIRLIDSSRP